MGSKLFRQIKNSIKTSTILKGKIHRKKIQSRHNDLT